MQIICSSWGSAALLPLPGQGTKNLAGLWVLKDWFEDHWPGRPPVGWGGCSGFNNTWWAEFSLASKAGESPSVLLHHSIRWFPENTLEMQFDECLKQKNHLGRTIFLSDVQELQYDGSEIWIWTIYKVSVVCWYGVWAAVDRLAAGRGSKKSSLKDTSWKWNWQISCGKR